MPCVHSIRALLLLIPTAAANADYWVSEIDGQQDDFRIVRVGEEVPVQQLMLLRTGDTIEIRNDSSGLVLIDSDNESLVITVSESPYVIPESPAASSLLTNIGNWITSWWQTRANQSSTTLAAVSKGLLDPTPHVLSNAENRLLSGHRSIYVAWAGGSPPFDVSLTTESGKTAAQAMGVAQYSVTLPEHDFAAGQSYTLQIEDAFGVSLAPIRVVGPDELPGLARSLVESTIPDAIRFGNLAMILSGLQGWRFESQQLAHTYHLDDLEQSLLDGTYPSLSEEELELVSAGEY